MRNGFHFGAHTNVVLCACVVVPTGVRWTVMFSIGSVTMPQTAPISVHNAAVYATLLLRQTQRVYK